jgi:tetratricopeptide (TPR) repeat protein
MVTVFRFVMLLMVLAGTASCQGTKPSPEVAPAPNVSEAEQLYQQGRAAYLSEDYQAAAEAFARVVELEPTHIKALVNWGVSLSRGGDPKASIPKYEQALSRDPNNAWAMYNLGVALQRLGEHDTALIQYQRAVERDPAILTPELESYIARKSKRDQDSQINPQTSSPETSSPAVPTR